MLLVGDYVSKTSGDYQFHGVVVAVFQKLDKISWRVVVENSDGVLHIFNMKQLEKASPKVIIYLEEDNNAH
ncbi:hypothetical protein [Caudoviricetes sp.]|nr:hypothetical protein [Caudoviricetes sp.]